jgi:serine/threonine protein kinase
MSSTSTPFDWCLTDILEKLEHLNVPSQATLSKYDYNGEVYMIKTQPDPLPVRRECEFLTAAFDISVEIKGHIRRNKTDDNIIGFVMPCLCAIEPSKLPLTEKIRVFQQICKLIPQLHEHHKIIHGDIKLANMLLDGSVIKLCDFGNSAWISEVIYPKAISIRWSSPYRLGSDPDMDRRPLIPEEDVYASGITVWELFVGEDPFGPYVSQDEEFDLWDKIVDGLTVDIDRIQFEEARLYVDKCLSIKACAKVDRG